MSSNTVLLVEKDDDLRRVVAASMRQCDLSVLEAEDASQGEQMLAQGHVDVLLLPMDHAKQPAIDLIDQVREQSTQDGQDGAVVFFLTQRMRTEKRKHFAPDLVVYKPYDVRSLCQKVIELT